MRNTPPSLKVHTASNSEIEGCTENFVKYKISWFMKIQLNISIIMSVMVLYVHVKTYTSSSEKEGCTENHKNAATYQALCPS